MKHYPLIQHPSPNYNNRPRGAQPSLIVLHTTGGSYPGDLRTLTTRRLHGSVSAHYLIPKSGTRIKLVPCQKRAWHAGPSVWGDCRDVNDIAIGIELTHVDGKEAYPAAQLESCAELCAELCRGYGILANSEGITGHAMVAIPKGRKVDPRAFPWETFFALVKRYLAESA
jgi:N-acetylmuramoyl-L-alanine amidase